MSEMELHIGKLIKVPKEKGESLFQQKIRLLFENHFQCEPEESIDDVWEDFSFRKFYIYKDEIYKIENERLVSANDFLFANPIKNGFNYTLQFHNSGSSFYEALEEALEQMEKKNDRKMG